MGPAALWLCPSCHPINHSEVNGWPSTDCPYGPEPTHIIMSPTRGTLQMRFSFDSTLLCTLFRLPGVFVSACYRINRICPIGYTINFAIHLPHGFCGNSNGVIVLFLSGFNRLASDLVGWYLKVVHSRVSRSVSYHCFYDFHQPSWSHQPLSNIESYTYMMHYYFKDLLRGRVANQR